MTWSDSRETKLPPKSDFLNLGIHSKIMIKVRGKSIFSCMHLYFVKDTKVNYQPELCRENDFFFVGLAT